MLKEGIQSENSDLKLQTENFHFIWSYFQFKKEVIITAARGHAMVARHRIVFHFLLAACENIVGCEPYKGKADKLNKRNVSLI